MKGNKIMNIVLYNRDEYERKRLERLIIGIVINQKYSSEIVLSSNDKNNIIEYAKKEENVSLYFLDIDYNGFEIAEEIRKSDEISPIVLLTDGSVDLAMTYEYKIKAFDLIIKSDYADFLKKAEYSIISAENRQRFGYANCISIRCRTDGFSIPYDNIYFIETISGSHRLLLHTETHTYEFYANIKDVIKNLDKRFNRCHKSVIVNSEKVIGKDKQKKNLILLNGDRCPYSSKLLKKDFDILQYTNA